MIPLSVEFGIREALKLLSASRLNFKSRQVEQARRLLEKILELEYPNEKTNEQTGSRTPQKSGTKKTDLDHT